VEYLEEEAMPHVFDQHGNKVHCQPIETFVNRMIGGLDKNWMKQRLISAMSQNRITTRKDVTKCLLEAVNELRLSKEHNLDPSGTYPNTMSHLNVDRYAIAAPDTPGLYEPDQERRIAAIVEDVIRRLGAETATGAAPAPTTTRTCFECGKPGHLKSACRAAPRVCTYCKKTGHYLESCWTRDPSRKPPGIGSPSKGLSQARIMEMMKPLPEAPVFPRRTVNATVPQTVPNTEHSAIRQMGKTSAYTYKGYLEHPAAKTGSREPVDVMVDSGNTTAATAAIF
jgi:hypothetical protein